MMVHWRLATKDELDLLAEWNNQLIRDEGHSNPMTQPELRERMAGWLGIAEGSSGGYSAVIFSVEGQDVAYALFRESPTEIYLRQFFVRRDQRRRGIGARSFQILREEIWSRTKRLTVEVLTANHVGVAFWHALGYRDYSLMLEILPEELTH